MYRANNIYNRCLTGLIDERHAIRQLLHVGRRTNDATLRTCVAHYILEIRNWR